MTNQLPFNPVGGVTIIVAGGDTCHGELTPSKQTHACKAPK